MRRNWCRRASGSRSLAKSSWRRNFWLARSWRLRGERQNDYHFAGGRDSYRRKVSYACGRKYRHACDQFCGSGWGCDVDGAGGVEFSAGDDRHVSSADCGDSDITPDHLDRHKTFANYVNAKARVFENQGRTISPCSTPTTPRPLDWRGEREGS